MRLGAAAVTILLVLLAGPIAAFAASCTAFEAGIALGQPEPKELIEISGMAASRVNPGLLWVHNDSGSEFRLFALTADGKERGYCTSKDIGRGDWEDMAIGPGPMPGKTYIYVADTGDNREYGKPKRIYRFLEPEMPASGGTVVVPIPDVARFTLLFPNDKAGPFDCEAILVDPRGGGLYLMTKDTNLKNGGKSEVFRASGALDPGKHNAMEHVLTLDLDAGLMNLVTGADIAPDGSGILVRTYLDILYWPRAAGQSIGEALAATPCHAPQVVEPQGEAIAFAADGNGYYTASERRKEKAIPPIHYFQRVMK
ncbi:MAG: hypothetical protein HYV27_09455 [Candidatus Hydrogenedentes bacterium]|nr:hypothetical protein [Candidatus Hydrogenedentota bacterium]